MNKALKRKIDSVDVVSFDIFDTLILRKVSEPSDVFDLVERKYKPSEKLVSLLQQYYENEEYDKIISYKEDEQ